MTRESEDRSRNEPSDLRARLLDAEPMDPAGFEALRLEVQNMYTKKLTPKSRAYWVGSLIASLMFVLLGVSVVLRGGISTFLYFVWGVYILANVGMCAFCILVLKRGTTDIRHFLAMSKISPGLTLVVIMFLAMWAVEEKSIQALAWTVVGVAWLVLAISITIYNRIIAAELATREQVLRLELKIHELLGKAGNGPATRS